MMGLRESCAEELRLVFEPRADAAQVDEIPAVAVEPFIFDVVNDEF